MSHFNIKRPGIYSEEISIQPKPIEGVSTSSVAFIGETQTGPTTAKLVNSWSEFQQQFGSYFGEGKFLPYAVEGFFLNKGQRCFIRKVVNNDYDSALIELEGIDEVSIIYAPNAQAVTGLSEKIIRHCERLRNRFTIFDSIKGQKPSNISRPRESVVAALYYPWIQVKEALTGKVCLVPPGGHVAGVYVRTDSERGVHKAPANQIVKSAVGLELAVDSTQQAILNPQGVNCILSFPSRGILVWGARTLSSDSEKKYVNVQRLMIYLEQSIKKGTSWVVFEPNNAVTWLKVKQMVDNFLEGAWRDGMLQGSKQQEAYIVKCDRSTMTQNDIDNGRLIVLIAVAPAKPAEFLIIRIVQTIV